MAQQASLSFKKKVRPSKVRVAALEYSRSHGPCLLSHGQLASSLAVAATWKNLSTYFPGPWIRPQHHGATLNSLNGSSVESFRFLCMSPEIACALLK